MKRFLIFALLLTLIWLVSCTGPTQNTNSNTLTSNTNSNASADNINSPTANSGSSTDSNVTENVECNCALRVGSGDFHEPPIGSGNGSFYFDVTFPNFSDFDSPVKEESGSFKDWFRYGFKSLEEPANSHKFIDRVGILTETDLAGKGAIEFKVYSFTEQDKAKLRFWIRDKVQKPTDTDYDAVLDGASGGSLLTKRKFSVTESKSDKTYRQKRYLFNNRDLSVVKWEIVTGDNETVKNSDSGDDMYYFYIRFEHD